jgi:3-deoxy-manno-octulosonate cytidylyltransferase (CMP-KDO synthetase)
MKILGVIPARYASTRFPGKPLAVINGKTMIQRVYEQAIHCKELEKVIVATDHKAISDHVHLFHGNVLMTDERHKTGTERCCEVVERLRMDGEHYDCVINVQGDEPYIQPAQISLVAACFTDPETHIATLIKKIATPEELSNPNVVKVVIDKQGYAIFFSRSIIPFVQGKAQSEWLSETTFYKHIGIYGYLTPVLQKIVSLPPSELELAESLEQLRWLENGQTIKTHITGFESIAIDTPADLLKIINTGQTFPNNPVS